VGRTALAPSLRRARSSSRRSTNAKRRPVKLTSVRLLPSEKPSGQSEFLQPVVDPALAVFRPFSERQRSPSAASHARLPAVSGKIDEMRPCDGHDFASIVDSLGALHTNFQLEGPSPAARRVSVRREKVWLFSGCDSHPATGRSSRSASGGSERRSSYETVGAFEKAGVRCMSFLLIQIHDGISRSGPCRSGPQGRQSKDGLPT